jgi:hypothetical protein
VTDVVDGGGTGGIDANATARDQRGGEGFAVGHTGVMEREHAELSSVAAALAEALERVDASIGRLNAAGRAAEVGDLYEVERSLGHATRRLDAVVRSLAPRRRD